jgi:transposase
MRGKKGTIYVKEYNQGQLMLLPPDLQELISASHPVRLVSAMVDKLDLSPLYASLDGGGAPIFHPKMMLKVILYAYMTNIYSSRRMEAALQENIHFMWLAGMNRPDHNTLNRFRSHRSAAALKPIFAQVVHLLADQGVLSLKEAFVDGTKLEANAGRYTFVWAKSVHRHTEGIKEKINDIWKQAQAVAKQEHAERHIPRPDIADISPEKIAETIERIQTELQGKTVPAELKKKIAEAKKLPQRLAKYQQQASDLGLRNSCSKTDKDATFMRLKEEHLSGGQLKAAYNCQISTSNQYITSHSIHQTAGDSGTLLAHIQHMKQSLGQLPAVLCADAGYGSEQNYQFLQDQNIMALVKYNTQDLEQKKAWQADIYKSHNLPYSAQTDTFTCPAGKPLNFAGLQTKTTLMGYVQHYRRYQAQDCQGCPMRQQCHKAEGNRNIDINQTLNALRKQARETLASPEGKAMYRRRGTEVESVFGQMKHNHHLRRFSLRGLEKVDTEFGWHALAHNMRKRSKAELGPVPSPVPRQEPGQELGKSKAQKAKK